MSKRAPFQPGRAVTRADVARYAGVSTAVVSYVINAGPKPVAADTAARVRAAIEQLDYRPNPNARALRTGTTEMLGLVLSDSTNPYFVELAAAIETAAAQRGHALMVGNSHGDRAVERQLISDLTRRQVDGIMVAILARPDYAAALHRLTVPIVWLDVAEPVPGYSSLGSDGREGAALGVRHLVQHGHTRIGLLIGQLGTGDRREHGWRETLHAAGLPEGPVAQVPWTREGGLEGGLQLLSAPDRPTAVFASSDLLAVGLLRAARELGLRVPEDLAVVSFDGTKESPFAAPPLTVVRQDIEAIAAKAVALILDRELEPSNHVLPTSLIIRESCGCQQPVIANPTDLP